MQNLPVYKNKRKNRFETTISAITLILLLAIGTLVACVGTVLALVPSTAWLKVNPNPVGPGQDLLVTAWITPNPPTGFMGAPNTMVFRTGYTFVFTRPDNTTDTIVKSSYADGSAYIIYKPNQLGTWTLKLTWAGDNTFSGSESRLVTFTVQQQQVPSWPDTPLPTGYWTFPINAQNRAWYTLAGDWLASSYDSSKTNFNPYSPGPTTAHILWAKTVGLGGIMGGTEGTGSYTVSSAPLVMDGYAYYTYTGSTIASPNQGYNIVNCVNLNTGETVWQQPINGTMYLSRYSTDPDPGSGASDQGIFTMPAAGNVYVYNPATGMLSTTYKDPSAGISMYDGAYFYYNNGTNLIKWFPWGAGTVGISGTFTDKKVVYSVPLPAGIAAPTQIDTVTNIATNTWANVGYNMTTGQFMWNTTSSWTTTSTGAGQYHYGNNQIIEFNSAFVEVPQNGKLYLPTTNMSFAAFNLNDGSLAWETALPATAYPYGSFWTYAAAAAYGLVYEGNYDGHLYAFNQTGGAIAWSFYSGDSGTETPEGSWPWWNAPVVANGMVYGGTTQHLPNDPATRGYRLYALNALTGKLIWSIAFDHASTVVADGMVLAANIYDGKLYCFSKGPSATTVSATPGVGNAVTIQGSVTDQSPGMKGAAVASDADMSAWMEYLYMQQPLPDGTSTYPFYATGTPTTFSGQGVSVKLTATGPSGGAIDLGTVTTGKTGTYAVSWTPPSTGLYTITASFAGTDSYYKSSNQTYIAVGSFPAAASAAPTSTASPSSPTQSSSPTGSENPTPTPSVAPTPPGTSANIDMYVLIAVAVVVIAVVVASVVYLRRRK